MIPVQIASSPSRTQQVRVLLKRRRRPRLYGGERCTRAEILYSLVFDRDPCRGEEGVALLGVVLIPTIDRAQAEVVRRGGDPVFDRDSVRERNESRYYIGRFGSHNSGGTTRGPDRQGDPD
jgi:hypothetical protein